MAAENVTGEIHGFSDRYAGQRAIVFRVCPVRGLGFRKGDRFSQTTWTRFE